MTTPTHATHDATAGRPDRLPVRRLSFEDSLASMPRHFTSGGDLISSHLVAALSGVFPDGEEFFVRSVRHFRDEVTDPGLKRRVSDFIGQEAMHGRQHRAVNRRLAELGYPTGRIERFTRRWLGLRERFLSPLSNLAETAAAEHFTATLAEVVLSNDDVREFLGDPAIRDLLVWHSLEESEHKAVAFDVYRAVGGGERMRVATMKVLRITFVAQMAVHVVMSLLADPATYECGRLLESWRGFRGSPIASHDLWRQLCDYDRPGFHPDDRDTSDLVDHWRAELFGDDGTLKERMTG